MQAVIVAQGIFLFILGSVQLVLRVMGVDVPSLDGPIAIGIGLLCLQRRHE